MFTRLLIISFVLILSVLSHHEVSAAANNNNKNFARKYAHQMTADDASIRPEPNTGRRKAAESAATGPSGNDYYLRRSLLSVEDDVVLIDKIVGGAIVDPPFKYPFLAGLNLFNQERFATNCGGSLISPTVVITAAHCNKPDGGEYVWIGRHDLGNSSEWDMASQSFKVVEKAFTNPSYIGEANNHDNDIMLFLLDDPVDTEKWPPIMLDDGPIAAEVEITGGMSATVMGWVSQNLLPRVYHTLTCCGVY